MALPLCRQCKLRPVYRKGHPFCSKACSNSARKRPLAERFREYFQRGAPDACWPWLGTTDRDGYGVISDEHRRQIRAHRIAYELHHGPLPEGAYAMHTCDNPPCCNPNHLRAGDNAANQADKVAKRRQASGERHGRSKLTAGDVREIRRLYPTQSQQALAHLYGVSQTVISDIVRRVIWAHVE